MQLSLDCLYATRSVFAGMLVVTGRLFKNGGRLSFQLPLIILLQICGAAGNAQSTLAIAVHGNQTVETFSFFRINTISDTQTIDTFTMVKETGDYRLQVRNVLIPGTGFVRQGNRSLREVFIAPGYPLQIIISNNPAIQTEKIEGAWGELDSVFQKATIGQPAAFNLGYFSLNDPAAVKRYDQLLKTIDTAIDVRHRSLKDFLFYKLMRQAIDSSQGLLEINNHKTLYQPYLNQLSFGSLRNDIDRRYNYKLNLLTSVQIGKPSPVFRLKDTTGKIFSLESFRGKLVYMDLWASWCLPCRLETPYMHSIINRYKQRADIAFIGVAVSDKMSDWKRALKQDKPRWLQLHDSNTFVVNAYAVSGVPRYILIDKNGNVIDFNAPPPSQYAALTAIIDKALSN